MSDKTLVYKRWDGEYIEIDLSKERSANTSFDIQAQAGSFIICGLDVNYVNDKMNCRRRKQCVRIIIDNKKEIAKQLNVIGVNDKFILPDMAHHAGYLKERF